MNSQVCEILFKLLILTAITVVVLIFRILVIALAYQPPFFVTHVYSCKSERVAGKATPRRNANTSGIFSI
jgi:hypothetical protein